MRKIFSSHFSKKGSRPWKLQGCVTGPKNILPRAGGFFNQYNNTVLVWVHLLTTLKSNSGWFHSRLIPSYLKVMPELLDLIRKIPPCRIKQDWHSFQQLVRYALQAVSPAGHAWYGQLGLHTTFHTWMVPTKCSWPRQLSSVHGTDFSNYPQSAAAHEQRTHRSGAWLNRVTRYCCNLLLIVY